MTKYSEYSRTIADRGKRYDAKANAPIHTAIYRSAIKLREANGHPIKSEYSD